MITIFSPSVDAEATAITNTTKTTNANNTTASIGLWRVTGTVRILKLYGIVTTVLGANHTAAHWRLNDQTAQPAITLATGTTLSAAAVGSMIAKLGLAAAALVLNTSAAGRVIEPTTLETLEFSEFSVLKKSGANTDIEYRYTTTDTPTSGAIQFFCEYISLSADGLLVAL